MSGGGRGTVGIGEREVGVKSGWKALDIIFSLESGLYFVDSGGTSQNFSAWSEPVRHLVVV